jgi:fibronectin type 3 domain-containing protein
MLFKKALETTALVWLLIILTSCGGGGETTAEVGTSSGNNSATLTWAQPTQRMNGDSLSSSEISAYRVYYGTSSGAYTNTKDVSTGSSCVAATCTTTITGLSGTYYFAVTAIDNSSYESDFSNEVSKCL